MKPVILIVDDEKNTREGMKKGLATCGYTILLASNAGEALRVMSGRPVDLLLTDLRMPGIGGMELMRRARELQPETIIILLTAYGTVKTAVEAMKEGAYDFLTKPINIDRLEMVVRRALSTREIERENVELKRRIEDRFDMGNIIYGSEKMGDILDEVKQIAPAKATVLISGESGTGKELIARAIHGLSDRRERPFVALHCAALAKELLESELFGHERGAFTGAVKRHRGRFELADSGTLFLDEVSEMDSKTQVKLLRVLQEHEFERVGGTEPINVDVRVIAATNADLEEMMRKGKFRDDLYYRLNVVGLRIPPLRERKKDIPALVDAFLEEFNTANGKNIRGITPAVLSALMAYDWPGNVRELRNCIEGLVILTRRETIEMEDLPPRMRGKDAVLFEKEPGGPHPGPSAAQRKVTTIKAAERRMVGEALRKTGGKRTEAAKLLGISRRTLHRKIRKFGLNG